MKMKQMQWWANNTDNACHHILNTNRVTEVYKNAGLTRYYDEDLWHELEIHYI